MPALTEMPAPATTRISRVRPALISSAIASTDGVEPPNTARRCAGVEASSQLCFCPMVSAQKADGPRKKNETENGRIGFIDLKNTFAIL